MFSLGVITTLASMERCKKLIEDRLEKSEEARKLLSACGTQLPVTHEVITDLEKFVIHFDSESCGDSEAPD